MEFTPAFDINDPHWKQALLLIVDNNVGNQLRLSGRGIIHREYLIRRVFLKSPGHNTFEEKFSEASMSIGDLLARVTSNRYPSGPDGIARRVGARYLVSSREVRVDPSWLHGGWERSLEFPFNNYYF